ncbi:MAG: hypothetical protein AAFQ51_04215 [Pseudomonadota bacterium]
MRPGPVAVLFCEDTTDIAPTLAHHQRQGFPNTLLIGADCSGVAHLDQTGVVTLTHAISARSDAIAALNRLIPLLAGRWVYAGFNAEYLFYPFCESRTVMDLTTFLAEERREAAFTYAIDLYAEDLGRSPNAVSRSTAHFDRSGYYGFQRYADGQTLDRQFDIYGGLGWRFEEFVPWERRRIDRVSLFRARSGLEMREDWTLNDPELNTLSCPWHHNITVAVASFRVAKSLKRNPGSMYEIDSFLWPRSERFDWTSQQLMELGMIEPGQWV